MERFLHRRGVLAALIVLGSVVLVPGARGAEDPAKDKKQAAAKSGDLPAVITNDVLDRMFGTVEKKEEAVAPEQAAAAAPSAAKPGAPPDPLKAMEEEQRRAAERQVKIAEAQKNLADAEARVRDLEQRRLAYRNPLLPRPKLSDEEANAQQGMDQAERVARTEQELAEARQEVQRAQAELAKARSSGP